MLRYYPALPGINVNQQGNQGLTPLHQAIRNKNTECVRLLLAVPGIDINKANRFGETPLHWQPNRATASASDFFRQPEPG